MDEQRAIRLAVHQGEKNAVKCLHSILSQTTARLGNVASNIKVKMEADEVASSVGSILRSRRGGRRRGEEGDMGAVRDLNALLDDLSDESSLTSERVEREELSSAASTEARGGGARAPVEQGNVPEGEVGGAMTRVRHRLLCPTEARPFESVPKGSIIELMRRVRFFHQAELQEELYSSVAEWFEAQCYEPLALVSREGSHAHSFCILASGLLLASERIPNSSTFAPAGELPPHRALHRYAEASYPALTTSLLSFRRVEVSAWSDLIAV